MKGSTFTSPYVLTEARIGAWDREGRGQGDGADYRPWLTVRNVKSRGRRHRMRGILHDRVLHLMSDLERNAVLHFEGQRHVVDIKEQFPLDRDVTRQIARAMGVRHPTDPVSKVEIVMTTDLLITFRHISGKLVSRAFSIKEAKDLLDPRTREKQEIERRYWERFGLRWNLMLDNILRDGARFEAIRWARDWFYVAGVGGLDAAAWETRCGRVLEALERAGDVTLGDFVVAAGAAGGFGSGEALSTLRHLAARSVVAFDPSLGVPTLASPLSRFSIATSDLSLAA